MVEVNERLKGRLGLGARWILSGTGDHLSRQRKRECLAVRGGNGYGHATGRPCDFSDSYSSSAQKLNLFIRYDK